MGSQRRVDDEEDEPSPPLPPDGGWGWVIVFGSFICNMLVDGFCFCYSVFFVEFLKEFGESVSKTAFVGSLVPGMYLMSGPFVSALANKVGCRAVTIVGAVIACLSFILSTFSPSLDVLIITYGIMGGIGFGLIYLPSIVIVNFWFEGKRAFATGIAVCGSGIGTFVFGAFAPRLIAAFGWKGATWILAGLILNCIVCGAVFRPLESLSKAPKRKESEDIEIGPLKPRKGSIMYKIIEDKKRQRTISSGSMDNVVITKDNKVVDAKKAKLFPDNKLMDIEEEKLKPKTTVRLENNNAIHEHNDKSETQKETTIINSTPNLLNIHNKALDRVRALKGATKVSFSAEDLRKRVLKKPIQTPEEEEYERKKKEVSRPMYRQDIFYTGSMRSIPEFQSQPDIRSYIKSTTSVNVQKEEGRLGPILNVLKDMFDFSILKCLTFDVICFMSVAAMLGFFTPFVYLYMQAIQFVDPNEAAFLLSIIGISNTAGRVVAGWLSDRTWADCLVINNFALVVAGAVCIAIPHCTQYWMFVLVCVIYGLCIACFISLRTIILTDLLGLAMLTKSFGILLLFQGIASVVGTPLAGVLYDEENQSYAISFYSSGILISVAGVVGFTVRTLNKWEKKHRPHLFESGQTQYVPVSSTEDLPLPPLGSEQNGHAQAP
ncbi:unnamed protein product [Owenia fusiformis]|nr:unnamed protein product [Owenia fusiformis]